MNQDNKEIATVRAVERAIKILKSFSKRETELTLGQISERVNLAKSTVHRIISSLENENFIEQDEESGKYRLSFDLIRLGEIASESINLQRIAHHEMQWLSNMSGQTSNLYVVRDYQRICIAQVPGPHYIMRFSYLGAMLPLYAGAAGKVLLAYKSEKWLDDYFQNVELMKLTDNTLSDKEVLMKELYKIRKLGYSVSMSERDAISSSASAPVFDYSGKMVAALTVSGPAVMFTEEDLAKYIPLLLESAKRLSSRLGYQSAAAIEGTP